MIQGIAHFGFYLDASYIYFFLLEISFVEKVERKKQKLVVVVVVVVVVVLVVVVVVRTFSVCDNMCSLQNKNNQHLFFSVL
jgi:hypothetical protein